ncbi:hypothetical protein [Burkholderia plantarii]|uniref:hypothetical protein n=1 Tax=Burkholderia plantarii TaxID=41899 RepID=UPI00385783B7
MRSPRFRRPRHRNTRIIRPTRCCTTSFTFTTARPPASRWRRSSTPSRTSRPSCSKVISITPSNTNTRWRRWCRTTWSNTRRPSCSRTS